MWAAAPFIRMTIIIRTRRMLQTSAHIEQAAMANCGLENGNSTGSSQLGEVWFYTGNSTSRNAKMRAQTEQEQQLLLWGAAATGCHQLHSRSARATRQPQA